MKKQGVWVLFAVCAAGCAPAAVVVPVGVPVFDLPFFEPNLDGSWLLSDPTGRLTCLTIQELQVSILNLTCSSDGSGFAARVVNGPVVDGGAVLSVTVTYNDKTFADEKFQLVFSGTRQDDGTYVGSRRDVPLARPEDATETVAFLTRK